MMKHIRSLKGGLFIAGAVALTTFAACSDTPTSNDQATVNMESQLESNTATLAKGSGGAGAEVDSLKVTKIRVFVSRLKLSRDGSDTTGDKNVKTEPFVITFQGQATTFANATVPPGTYDKVKFEFHRPSTGDVAAYLTNATFADFVTNGRYTVIYDVTLYKDNVAIPFVYSSDMNANLSVKLDQPMTLGGGSTTTLSLKLAAADIFSKGGAVLDPRDASNEDEIDNNIKAAIKLNKK